MQETLDKSLLKHDGITILDQSSFRIVISKTTEELVLQNFQVLMDLEEGVISFHRQSLDKGSVSHRLLDRLDDILKKVHYWSSLSCKLFFSFPKCFIVDFNSYFLLL